MLCSIVGAILFADLAAAFSSSPYSRVVNDINRCRVSRTSLKSRGDGDDQGEDMDAKIHALNKIFGVDDKSNEILIATSKRRRNLEREIELLSQLHPDHLLEESNPDSAENNIIAEFWSIWYGECGASNEKVLRAFEEELVGGGPSSWPDAEIEYLALIEENCGGGDGEGNGEDLDLSLWIEPANRLATLLYMMGRFEESKMWCERILEAKPWHIGALSGIIMLCAKLNDEEGIRKWASQAMPRMSEKTLAARKEWVERNVALAEEKLYQLEEMSQSFSYAKTSSGKESKLDDNEDLHWQ